MRGDSIIAPLADMFLTLTAACSLPAASTAETNMLDRCCRRASGPFGGGSSIVMHVQNDLISACVRTCGRPSSATQAHANLSFGSVGAVGWPSRERTPSGAFHRSNRHPRSMESVQAMRVPEVRQQY